MIARVWRGWTAPKNAEAYETLLKSRIFPGIAARGIAGYRGIRLLRLKREDEVEFVTIMVFESLAAVRAFAGEDYGKAYVPPEAQRLLSRFDKRSLHYEQREMLDY